MVIGRGLPLVPVCFTAVFSRAYMRCGPPVGVPTIARPLVGRKHVMCEMLGPQRARQRQAPPTVSRDDAARLSSRSCGRFCGRAIAPEPTRDHRLVGSGLRPVLSSDKQHIF